jgi:hypothetical protein
MTKKQGLSERQEAWFRIIVGIVSGILLSVWKVLIQILAVIHWFVVVFTGKRNKDMADLCEYWNTEVYKYLRYLTMVSNKRPFPFSNVERITRFEK